MGRVERGGGRSTLSCLPEFSQMVEPVFARGDLVKNFPTSFCEYVKVVGCSPDLLPNCGRFSKKGNGHYSRINTVRKVVFSHPNFSISLVSKFNKSWLLLYEYWGFIKSVFCAVKIIIAFYIMA
jgi:hypothetical protein